MAKGWTWGLWEIEVSRALGQGRGSAWGQSPFSMVGLSKDEEPVTLECGKALMGL